MKNSILIVCLIILNAIQALGQTFTVKGSVEIANPSNVAKGASAALITTEGKPYKGAFADDNGNFEIPEVEPGSYQLSIGYVGYETYTKDITLIDQSIDVGVIILDERTYNLGEVKIEGHQTPAIQKGDTTEFNADAYKTNPDADAQDLIEKLPGVVLDRGRVQAQGEDVRQVLVDGKPFFGNDPTAALRNLPAEVVQKIEIFDQQSEQSQFTGFNDGNTQKTINIVTRPGMRNGEFGKMYAGYGQDNTYQGGGNINIFNEDQRISIIGQTNNINQQNFSTEDLLGVVGSSGSRRGGFGGGGGRGGRRGGRGGGGTSVNDFLVGTQNGISETHSLGINYSDNWGKKWEVSGSYFFNYQDNNALEDINQTYFLEGVSDQDYAESNQTDSRNINHRFNSRMEYNINTKSSLIIIPRLTVQENAGTERTEGFTFQGAEQLNSSNSLFSSDLSAVNFSNMILYRQRFEKRGRSFSVRLQTGYNENNGDNDLESDINYFTRPISFDTLRQRSNLVSDQWSLGANISYTEPLSQTMMLQTFYEIEPQWNDSEKETLAFQEITNDYTRLDTGLSSTFSNLYLSQQIGTGIRYFTQNRKLMGMIRVAYQWANLDNEQVFPSDFDISRTFRNVIPMAMMRYRINQQKNFMLFYRPSTQVPSVTQLQDVLDNSNPIRLSIGNSDLEQNIQHRLFMRYSSTKTEKGQIFFLLLSGSYADNYIGNNTIIANRDTTLANGVTLQQGGQLSQPVNIDGYRNLRSVLTFGFPVRFLKSNLNLNLTADYTRSPGLVNNETNFANSGTLGLGVVLSSNFSEKVDFTISSRSNVSQVENSLRTDLNQEYFNQNTSLRLNLIFWDGMVFRSTIAHQLYSGLSDGFNDDFILWNMGLARKFLKDDRGELQVSVFDLLKQNNSISRTISDAYIQDVRTNVLQQYVMLTFTYQLRHFKI